MSATLLWCVIVLGTHATAAYVVRNGTSVITTVESETFFLGRNGFSAHNPNRRILVEEVDKNGNSVVKELELPDYEDDEDLQGDRKRIEHLQKEERQSEKLVDPAREDLYGCGNLKESQRKKCLQRQRKFLKIRYRNWKALIRRIIKDLDGKIKTIGHGYRTQSTTENLNFMSGVFPKNVMRKKE